MEKDSKLQQSGIIRSELSLLFGAATVGIFTILGDAWLADLSNPLWYGFLLVWLFAVMLWLAFGVVRHADSLAVILGEPYGTLILTGSVIGIEVTMFSAVMLTGEGNPTLARDTLMAVLMIVLNGVLGIMLLVGGLRHREQSYNLRGAATYLGVIIPLAGLGLILPRYMPTTPGGQVTTLMAVWLIVISVSLYGAFLWIQTLRHRVFFQQPSPLDGAQELLADEYGTIMIRSLRYHVVLLPMTILPFVLLSEKMAVLVDHGITTLGAPQALGGILVATLVLFPESMAAIKAALANKLQRAMNISLGSTLSTIGLTIPAVLGISLLTGVTIELGLDEAEVHLLLFTLLVAAVNFTMERTNVLHGLVHLVLFLTYIVLIFD